MGEAAYGVTLGPHKHCVGSESRSCGFTFPCVLTRPGLSPPARRNTGGVLLEEQTNAGGQQEELGI